MLIDLAESHIWWGFAKDLVLIPACGVLGYFFILSGLPPEHTKRSVGITVLMFSAFVLCFASYRVSDGAQLLMHGRAALRQENCEIENLGWAGGREKGEVALKCANRPEILWIVDGGEKFRLGGKKLRGKQFNIVIVKRNRRVVAIEERPQ